MVGALRALGSLPGGKLPEVLVILDGASEPIGAAPTSLERAHTPALDGLASEGELMRVRTVPPGLPPGSEVAIPALLGWSPTGPVDRGALEAAARGIAIGRGERAWRVDVVAGAASRPPGVRLAANVSGSTRADEEATERAARTLALAAPGYAVHRLAGHRLLVIGRPPLPAAAFVPDLHVWPEGLVPPEILCPGAVVIGAPGAAVGAARLMGARTVVPDGATGLPDSDLAAKAAAAVAAIAAGARLVVVHVGGPDEASHLRDRAAKIRSLERADLELIAPLAGAVGSAGGVLRVGPDHGCDPETGAHDATPVPWLAWWGGDAVEPASADPAIPRRLTERVVAGLAARSVSSWLPPEVLAQAPPSLRLLSRSDNALVGRSRGTVGSN